MGRRNTESWNTIHTFCRMMDLEEKSLYEKSKMLLSIYRRICWNLMDYAVDTKDEILFLTASKDLDGALIYLEEFAPDREREKFESKVASLFRSKWMVELVDTAMLKVRNFPDYGEMYFEILSKNYLTSVKYSEGEMLEVMHLERSRYYDRKKEAVMVFGLSLWGGAIPKLREILNDEMEEEAYVTCECM